MTLVTLDKSTEGIATLTLCRPDVRNSLNEAMTKQLGAHLVTLDKDDRVGVVVLRGQGPAFCSGVDLNWFQQQVEAVTAHVGMLLRSVRGCSKPVVACVHGPAIGGGAGLMAACDIVIASREAFMAFPEVRLGLVPALVSPYVVERLGLGRARRYFLTGEQITVEDAHSLGLVDVVVEHSELDEMLDRVVQHLMKGSPAALAACKRLTQQYGMKLWADALDFASQLIVGLAQTEDTQARMEALVEWKRLEDS